MVRISDVCGPELHRTGGRGATGELVLSSSGRGRAAGGGEGHSLGDVRPDWLCSSRQEGPGPGVEGSV